MAARIRVLGSANRTMQRLGYLKALAALVNEIQTSNLETLGKRLIARVTQRVKFSPPFDQDLQAYAKTRLTDRAYRELRKTVMENASPANVSLQDVYLSDPSLPSSTGKLVEANWRRYPYLGTSLALVKQGTYSALTRSVVLLTVTPREEIEAFKELNRKHNPLRISSSQATVLLYCLLDNDAEVFLPLLQALLERYQEEVFDERSAGNLLPGILRKVAVTHAQRSLTAAERSRLSVLKKIAANVAKSRGKPYTGSGAREEAIRVRLEPYCDLGMFSKPVREKYDYQVTKAARALVEHRSEFANTGRFLQEGFFTALAASREIEARPASNSEAIDGLASAGEDLKSSLGYTPITDVGLLAGTRLLEKERILELNRAVDLLKSLQKQDPTFVRFTVDRMGSLAYVKFLRAAPVG